MDRDCQEISPFGKKDRKAIKEFFKIEFAFVKYNQVCINSLSKQKKIQSLPFELLFMILFDFIFDRVFFWVL